MNKNTLITLHLPTCTESLATLLEDFDNITSTYLYRAPRHTVVPPNKRNTRILCCMDIHSCRFLWKNDTRVVSIQVYERHIEGRMSKL